MYTIIIDMYKLLLTLLVILLILYVFYKLYMGIWFFQEGLTQKELEEKMEIEKQERIQSVEGRETSLMMPKTIGIHIQDNQQYSENMYRDKSTFIDQYPNASYLVQTIPKEEIDNISKEAQVDFNKAVQLTLPMETSRFASYMIIRPTTDNRFPKFFTLDITNFPSENKKDYVLWGDSGEVDSSPNNNVITPYNVKSHPHPKDLMQVEDGNIYISKYNMGRKILHIYTLGTIFDNKYANIGNVDTVDDKISIQCSSGHMIDSIMVYFGVPSEI